jgi:uncharacterized membrane protein
MPTDSSHLQEHIDIVVKHEEEFLARRTTAERLGDSLGAFVGSLTFIVIHLLWFAGWILLNTLPVAHVHHFDPPPFSLLNVVVALEAIFLASFIVMRQSRMSRRSDERDHLILQVLMLAEKEVTAVLQLERHIAAKAGLTNLSTDEEIVKLSEKTSIDEMAETIKESLSGVNESRE